MKKTNQILTAIILYCIISYILNLSNLPQSLIIAATATQLCIILPKNYRHTLLLYISLALLAYKTYSIAIPIMAGYTASIFIELLSKEGCKLLYPLKNTTFTGPKNYIENNTKKDHAITIFLLILALTTLTLSTNGQEIITTLNESNITQYLDNHTMLSNQHQNYVQYINIDAKNCRGMNITTTHTNNTTTTIIKNYSG